MRLSPLPPSGWLLFHHFITPCGLLLFRSIGLPMGNSFTCLGRFRHYAGRDIPHQQERLGNGVHPQPAPGSYLLQSGHRLSEHSQRSGIHHSFHVSAGRGTGHDGLFGEKRSFAILFAVLVSLSGAGLLSSGK